MQQVSDDTVTVAGARWGSFAAGIKRADEQGVHPLDLALLELQAGSTVAAVFTQNAFKAAPVALAQQRLPLVNYYAGKIYCLINAGNANAGTGEAGFVAAEQSTEAIANALSTEQEAVLPFSTGVIGEPLPVACFEANATKLVNSLCATGWEDAARAIMTTDTVPKLTQYTIIVGDETVNIAGIAKGAGMIKPNMATMLAYIVCDAAVDQNDLDALLSQAVNQSFNRITVDGDTSTNDACVLAATGASGAVLNASHPSWLAFSEAVCDVLRELAIAIIRDAEGASKFIDLHITGGASKEECLAVGYAVAESPLVKTAFFASDANWGRILAAVGRAGLHELDVNGVEIRLGNYLICANGGRVKNYSEPVAAGIMAKPSIRLSIELGRGNVSERLWTSDLSHDYVSINADYRT